MNNRKKGQFFEEIACKYLKNQGYTILERNFFTPFGEIDIICSLDDELIFVEVKGGNKNFSEKLEKISKNKIRRIRQSAEYYLEKAKYQDNKIFENLRIDAIVITKEGNFRVFHLKKIS